jgi:hypothetical protein
MAATTESVKADAAEAPLLNRRNLTLGILLYLFFYSFIRWYEGARRSCEIACLDILNFPLMMLQDLRRLRSARWTPFNPGRTAFAYRLPPGGPGTLRGFRANLSSNSGRPLLGSVRSLRPPPGATRIRGVR